MANNTKTGFKVPLALQYFITIQAGVYLGSSFVPDVVFGVVYIAFGICIIFFAFMGNLNKVLTLVPFFVYSEIYVRANVHFINYLFGPYILIVIFGLLLFKQGTTFTLRSSSFMFLFAFAIIDLVDCTRTNEPDFARLTTTNSFLLAIVALWAASNLFSVASFNTFLKYLKLAGVFLVGIVAAAHAGGHIDYVSHSASESTNGLAPVQISGYLGTTSILFFLSIVDQGERKNLILNLVIFVITTVLMILSFSRGGLYFLGAVIVIYLMFNWRNARNYSMLLLLVPIGIGIYSYVVSTTNGLIADRYAQEGASGRDQLVEVGFEIFKSDPVAGIGTGNFSKEIVKRGLYDVESGAHNEFIRAIAEHGILGLVTYWGFYISLFIEIMKRKGVVRQYSLYFFVLFCLILVHNGMKLDLQPIILILAIAIPPPQKLKKKPNKDIALLKPALPAGL